MRFSRRVAAGTALLVALLLGGAVALQRRAPRAPVGAPNFLVVDIDTLSWDHVGVVRDGVSNTPNLDALAKKGTRFTHAFAPAGWTMPSLNGLLTGRVPVPLRLADGGLQWRAAGAHDFPEILSFYGYGAYAFFGVTVDARLAHAMSKGFDVKTSAPPRMKGQARGPRDNPPTGAIVDFFSKRPRAPFLAYVHEVDLHKPDVFHPLDADDPVSALITKAPDAPYPDLYKMAVAALGEPAAQAAIEAHYDRVVGHYDERLGAILAAVDKAGLADTTVVVVTSDHGNDFFEHADVDHGLLYDSTIRVPLVVFDPRNPGGGGAVDAVVQTLDIAPTLLELAGAEPDQGMDGRSLVPFLLGHGGDYAPRPVVSLSDACHASYREPRWKLILRNHATAQRHWYPTRGPALASVTSYLDAAGITDLRSPTCTEAPGPAGQPAGQPAPVVPPGDHVLVELYDLDADPGEQHDVAAANPAEVVRLLRLLLPVLEGRPAGEVGSPLTADQVQQMKEQGYWGFVQ